MNMIQNAKAQVLELTLQAYNKAADAGLLPAGCPVQPSVEIPKDTANGDYTTTFCLAAAKALKKNPRELAQLLLDNMELSGSYFTSAAMAGPGFLNFTLGTRWFGETMRAVQQAGKAYGENDTLRGKKYMVEFVSANPTGPMHMGNARGGVLGNKELLGSEEERTCAAIMDKCLYRLEAEGEMELAAALLCGDEQTFKLFRTQAPELVHLPDATYEWYCKNYLDSYYPVRFILHHQGIEFPQA
mgnify:CR=1 FL=1